MKALIERLEWIRLALCELPDGPNKTAALDCWLGCEAIAEVLSDQITPPLKLPPVKSAEGAAGTDLAFADCTVSRDAS